MSKTRKIVDSLVTASGNSLIAQLVERRTVNPQVPGSSPGRGAKQINGLVFGLGRFRLVGDMPAVLAGIIWPGAIKVWKPSAATMVLATVIRHHVGTNCDATRTWERKNVAMTITLPVWPNRCYNIDY